MPRETVQVEAACGGQRLVLLGLTLSKPDEAASTESGPGQDHLAKGRMPAATLFHSVCATFLCRPRFLGLVLLIPASRWLPVVMPGSGCHPAILSCGAIRAPRSGS